MLGWEDTVDEYIDHLVTIFAEVKRVLKPTGVMWIVIGDSYSDKAMRQVPERLSLALVDKGGWRLQNEIIWEIPNRTPVSVTDRLTQSHEHVYVFEKQKDHFFDSEAIRERALTPGNQGRRPGSNIRSDGTRNCRSVWRISNEPFAGAHFCSFPKELVRRMMLAGCPEGGAVLDPFAGTGATGLVANALGRRAVLIEASPTYAGIAKQRIEMELPKYRDVKKRLEAKDEFLEAAE